MKKKLLALFLTCLMLLSALPVSAAKSGFTVELIPIQQSVAVGDTVYYSVVAEGADLVALQFELELPKGLSYVKGSAAVAEGLKDRLGVAALDWTEGSMLFSFYNDVGVTIPSGTQLMIFACVAQTEGSYRVGLKEVLPFDGNFQELTPSVETVELTVFKEAQQEPGVSAPDGGQTSQDPEVETSKPQVGGDGDQTEQPGEGTGPDTPVQSGDQENTGSDALGQPGEITGTDQQPGEVTGTDTSGQPGDKEVTGTDQLQPGETEQGQTPHETAPQEQQPQNPEGNDAPAPTEEANAQTDSQTSPEQEEGSDLTVLWIALAVAAVAAAVAVILLRRKKRAAEKQD